MGMDIHIKATKYNEHTNFFDELILYKPGVSYHCDEAGQKIIDDPNYEKVYIYNGRNSEMFDGMKDGTETDGYGYFPWDGIKYNSLNPTLRKELIEKRETQGYFDFFEINLAEMKAYTLEHPTVVDYDAADSNEDSYPRKKNPIVSLYEEILKYISFADDDFDWKPLGNYKILFYFDW